jgi:hypothetical protein
MPYHHTRSTRADRRRACRWRDKRLLTLQETGSEHPGMTADVSPAGMRLALSRCASRVGEEVQINVAFAQEVMEVRGHLVHTQRLSWGMLAGIRFTPGQEELCRFLARRYPPLSSLQSLFRSAPASSPKVPVLAGFQPQPLGRRSLLR